jgi:hypothetical protein
MDESDENNPKKAKSVEETVKLLLNLAKNVSDDRSNVFSWMKKLMNFINILEERKTFTECK